MASSAIAPQKSRPGPVRAALERLIESGEIEVDPLQRKLADRLDALDRRLSAEIGASKKSALGWLFGSKREAEPVKGLYVHGDVGRRHLEKQHRHRVFPPGEDLPIRVCEAR